MADIRIKDLATTATTSASDDYLALDGSTNGTRKILATNVANNVTDVVFGASGPSAKSSIAARAPRQGLVFDGSNTVLTQALPADGTGDFSKFVWVYLTVQPSLDVPLFSQAANSSSLLIRGGTRKLNLSKSGVSYGTNNSSTDISLRIWSLVGAVKSGSTVTYYLNGVSDGTSPDSLNYTAGGTGNIGQNAPAGFALSGSYAYNRALSAAEVVALYEAGVPAGADYNTASNTALSLGNFANSGYDTFTGASATGFTAINTSVDGYAYTTNQFTLIKGARYQMTFTCTLTSGQVPVAYLGVPGSSVLSVQTRIAAGANVLEFTATASGASNGVFYSFNGEAVSYAISNFALTRLGLLLAPDAAQSGGGLTWYDTSGNAANITLPATGVTWNVPTSGFIQSPSALKLNPSTGNVLIGTTTDITGTGGLHVAGTATASTTTSGALRVGSNVGLSGNAGGASYFGGAATFAGAVSVASITSASSSTVGALTIGNGTAATNVAIGDGYIRAGSAIFANNAGTNTQLALGSVASAATTYSKLRTDGSGGLDISAGSGGALSFGYDNARPVGAYGVWTFNSTTPSTGVGTGALQVAGGIYAGAASVFGGTVASIGALWNSNTGNTSTNGFNDATNISSNIISVYGSTGSANIQKAGRITVFDGGSGYYGLNLQAPTSAYPNFSGTVNFTNVLTLTSQAATFAGTVIAPAATTALAPMRIPHGTAPTSPVNGDMWTTTAGLFVRINGVTVGPLS